ncbi:MAG TPA: M1 family metallopeptidase [Longimicrobiales bacterium]|nr:M1 family metallopeptidase [Longimicrobiales bacterium]
MRTSRLSATLRASPVTAAVGALAAIVAGACGGPVVAGPEPPAPAGASAPPLASWPPPRPIPRPIARPAAYEAAIERGTRTAAGAPGAAYWQQWTDHAIEVRVDPETKRLDASVRMDYRNDAPAALPGVVLELTQNAHGEGARRLEVMEVTGGVDIARVSVDGTPLRPGDVSAGPAYAVDGTVMAVRLPRPLAPRSTARIEIDYGFTIPQAGISGRMGWSGEDLLFLAYWYPRMAVFDDVVGWAADQYLGAEFYQGFGSFDYSVTLPEGWVVVGTGELRNPDEVLAPHVRARLERAEASDEVVHVVTTEDYGSSATASAPDGWLTWEFHADSVRDVAFSATRASNWDAARSPVGDRDGDGVVDYARVDAIWRNAAPRWAQTWRYAQHSVDFISRFTGQPYPWPHMSVVEGSGIIGGGMEFPMMTIIGDYNQAGDSALYYVTAHEIAHMWVPMLVASDERRYSWIDEGMTSFVENQARNEFYPGPDHDQSDRDDYIATARGGLEGSMMTRSDYHVPGPGFVVASYRKPATLLALLRGVLGDDAFLRAYREFHARWRFRHPYPWDFFATFEDVTGRDLSWFWGSFYEETWAVDHAVESVATAPDGSAEITIRDLGDAPLPVPVVVTRSDGSVEELEVPVDRWLRGDREAVLRVGPGAAVTRVEASPSVAWPDVDRDNNVWEAGAA